MYRVLRLVIAVFLTPFVTACAAEESEQPKSTSVSLSFDGAGAKRESELARHGERLSHLLGCTGCHQEDFSGGPFNQGRIAPNVSLLIADYEDGELERAIRNGIAHDGRKIRLMPSEMYQWLSDTDYHALELHLRTLEPNGEAQTLFEPLPMDVLQWEADGYTNANALGQKWVAASGPTELDPKHARGRYLAMNLCTECHNNQLQGYPGFTPDLSIVTAYSDEELERLLNEGKGNTRDELGLMSLVSPARFPNLTKREFADLADYLQARADALVQ